MDIVRDEEGGDVEVAEGFLTGHYVDLGDIPILRRVFATGTHIYNYGGWAHRKRRRCDELVARAAATPVGHVGIPLWVERSGTRGSRTLCGRSVHDFRDIRFQVHDPADVYEYDDMINDESYFDGINQALFTFEDLVSMSRWYLYHVREHRSGALLPASADANHWLRNRFEYWPMELLKELWRFVEKMTAVRSFDRWHFGEQRMHAPPYLVVPFTFMEVHIRRGERNHDQWLTTEEEAERWFSNSDHMSRVGTPDGPGELAFHRLHKKLRMMGVHPDDVPVAEMVEAVGI